MTNKVICVETLKAWAADRLAFYESHEREPLYESGLEVIKELITEINSDRLSPSPAPAEGVIPTVTNCPTCGSAVKVGGDGETHYYIPITAPSAQWLPVPPEVTRAIDYLDARSAVETEVYKWQLDIVSEWVRGLSTPTTNTREGM